MKKLYALLCIALLLSFSIKPACAFTPLEDEVLDKVISLYGEYYAISNASAEVISTTQNPDGTTTYLIDTSFYRTLKATSAYEIPFIQGLLTAKADLSDSLELASADRYIDFWINELEQEYIGVAQPTNAAFSVTLSSAAKLRTSETIGLEDIMYHDSFSGETYSAEELRPKSDSELKAEGIALIADISATVQEESTQLRSAQKAYTYSRTLAISYARRWSCNLGLSEDHATCHAPGFLFCIGADCANFVSQCLFAGGIEPDNIWFPENQISTAWYTTGNSGSGLRQYVVNTLGFIHTGIARRAVAGSIINQLTESGANAGHVGLVDQNDTIVTTFCAHTRCRNSAPFSTLRPGYDFYTPELLYPPEV